MIRGFLGQARTGHHGLLRVHPAPSPRTRRLLSPAASYLAQPQRRRKP